MNSMLATDAVRNTCRSCALKRDLMIRAAGGKLTAEGREGDCHQGGVGKVKGEWQHSSSWLRSVAAARVTTQARSSPPADYSMWQGNLAFHSHVFTLRNGFDMCAYFLNRLRDSLHVVLSLSSGAQASQTVGRLLSHRLVQEVRNPIQLRQLRCGFQGTSSTAASAS